MNKRIKRKITRKTKQLMRNRSLVIVIVIGLVCAGMIGYGMYQNRRLAVDTTTYGTLLDVIARVESKGNYNAYFGNASNQAVDFTAMSIADVMKWQQDFISRGNPSSAVGRYQIIHTTLGELVAKLQIDPGQKFNAETQDKLAIALLERRGAVEYVNKELTRDQFAANLAMEWAALPKIIGPNPSDSYYAGDGLNRALISVDDMRAAIEPIKAK